MRLFFLIAFLGAGLISEAKTYLKIELENANHVIIFDGTLYVANGKFEGEIDPGKHAISILKHNFDLNSGKVKTEIIYEGMLDLSDNMFYVYKLSSVYLNFVSVDVYTPVVVSNTTTTTNNTPASVSRMDVPNNATAMDEANFESFLAKVKEKNFDDKKLEFVKSTMKNNWINSDQALAILQNLSFENNKVELAKILYHKTIDKGNYFKIYDAFTFSSSERSVQEYVDAQ